RSQSAGAEIVSQGVAAVADAEQGCRLTPRGPLTLELGKVHGRAAKATEPWATSSAWRRARTYALRDGKTCNPKPSTSRSITFCGTCRRFRPVGSRRASLTQCLLVPKGRQRVDRAAQLAPLGLQRVRVLECLGGNDPRMASGS